VPPTGRSPPPLPVDPQEPTGKLSHMVRLEFAHAGYNEALTLSLVPPAPTAKLRASFSQHLLGSHISDRITPTPVHRVSPVDRSDS